ncbi:MAG: hypothetical protein WB622_06025 [Acidobacteriaceae bacterium]
MRSAVSQAGNAATTAANTAAGYGAGASTIGSALVPYEARQLTNPAGMSQADIGAQLTAGLAGAGGATSGLQGAASKMAATTRNPMGFSAGLDAASRARAAASARTSEGIAANNADVKLQQQSDAARTLGSLYGTDVSGQNAAAGQQANDINAQVNASKSGWLQNMLDTISTISGAAKGAGSMGVGFGQGQTWGPGGCWVAAEIFGGWEEPRTVLVRNWLNTEFRKSLLGGLVMRFYLAFGERIAAGVRRSKLLRVALTPLFELALRKAEESK